MVVLGYTLGRVATRVGAAGVDLHLTVPAGVGHVTVTRVVVDAVYTLAVHAGVAGTLVDVVLAVLA